MECKKCLFDTDTTDAVLDSEGICNYCRLYEEMEKEYSLNESKRNLVSIVKKIKKTKKKNQKYDCIIGISGGLDSSFLLYLMVKKYKLKPLAVHFDNSWNSDIAINNIKNLCTKFDVDFIVYKVKPNEFDDIIMAFLKAGVLDIDAPTDIGLITTLYETANKYHIKYILEGHSFRTEGVQPLNWAYVDGKYIADVHKKYGKLKMETFSNLWIRKFVIWTAINKIKRVRPLYYIDYDKNKAREILYKYGFENYEGHHYENRWSAFNYSYYLPKRANIDGRLNEICAYVRRGIMSKEVAKQIISAPIECDEKLLYEVKKRLHLTQEDLDFYINQSVRTWREFKTYKNLFYRTKIFWFILYKTNIIPKSFYVKYCKS